jgi:hypothetical protein
VGGDRFFKEHLPNSLLVLHSLYHLDGRTILDHISRRRSCLGHITGCVDNTLSQIARIKYRPLGFYIACDKHKAHAQHVNFYSHIQIVLSK